MDSDIIDNAEDRISFYPKWSILLFSALGSVLFGAILMAININKTENKKNTPSTIFFALIFIAVCAKLVTLLKISVIYSVFGQNIIGGLILIFPIWKHNLGAHSNYQPKPIWIPLIILISSITALILLNLFAVNNYR
ncbi:MAG: hypothetical protein ACHQF2_10010 [Flavobacteriales bacterium]